MELNYENMMNFMLEYFPAFVKYGQNPNEKHRLHEYFAKDFDFFPYFHGVGQVTDRDVFLTQMSSHPSCREEMEPDEIFIDEKRHVAVALLSARIVDAASNEVLVSKKYCPIYWLGLEDGKIKIKKIRFFWEQLAAGETDVLDAFTRDGRP